MDKKLSILNILLFFAAGILITWIIRIWVAPDFPSRIDGSSLVGSPKSLQEFSANRKVYPQSIISKIMAKNLFRKERTEYKVFLPNAKAENKPTLPPPEIIVKGIILLKSTKIAVLAGNFFIWGSNDKPEQKAIKKKGYAINEYIGDFQIIRIEKELVVFQGPGGATLKSYLKHPSKTPIQREANLFYYNKKKKPKEKPEEKTTQSKMRTHSKKQTSKPEVSKNQSPSTVSITPSSKAPRPSPPIARVSGALQSQRPQPANSISGARSTSSRNPIHFSGR